MKADPRLAESVDAADRTNRVARQKRERRAGERGQRATEAVACNPKGRLLRGSQLRETGGFVRAWSDGIQSGGNFIPGIAQRMAKTGMHIANLRRAFKQP